jgi:hypothetical protein
MHRGHRASQFINLHHSGSHLRILAKETGSRIATLNRFYDPKSGTISLDHLANGLTRLPGKLPEANGASSARTKPPACGMDNFNKYLKGSKFTLYRDSANETTLGTTQLKTLNRLRNTMIEHDFEIQNRQKAELPDFLKKTQIEEGEEISRRPSMRSFTWTSSRSVPTALHFLTNPSSASRTTPAPSARWPS